MIIESDERSIILLVELDTLDTLTTGSFPIRKVDFKHVGSEVFVEFYFSTTSRIHGRIVLVVAVVVAGVVVIIATNCQRFDYYLGWQEHWLHIRVVLQQVWFSFMFRF